MSESTRFPGTLPEGVEDVPAMAAALADAGYLTDTGLATAVFLSLRLARPLLLEGDPGVGKTELAKALTRVFGGPLIRLQCYEGIDVSQAVYEWSYARQLLHIRAMEVLGAGVDRAENAPMPATAKTDIASVEDDLFSERFLLRRPLLEALVDPPEGAPQRVLLIDEVDRADDEFEAFLLQILAEYSVTVPELGTFVSRRPPAVVVTSNRTREVHDALKRRCLYHWLAHPDFEREVEIVRVRLPGVPETLGRQVAALVQILRGKELFKPPGVAETLDWAESLAALGAEEVTTDLVEATFGAVLKYREDQERVRDEGVPALLSEAMGLAG